MAKTRRRGSELEQAVFQATREILNEEGLAKLSFSKIAERAGTSKPVIYRHWESPFALALLAIQDKIKSDNHGRVDQVALTGTSLAEDLFQLYKRFTFSAKAYGQTILVSSTFGDISSEQFDQIQQLIDDARQIDIHATDRVLQRAVERGELRTTEVPENIKLMPFEWIRYHLFTDTQLKDEELDQMVKDVFVPAFAHLAGGEK